MDQSLMSGSSKTRASVFSRYAAITCIAAFSLLGSGCMSVKQYVDPALPKVAFTELKPVDNKQSVQVLFEFRTKGTPNASATNFVKPFVLDTLKKSNLFSDVVTAPAAADSKLFITIENVVVDKDAFAKGFGTGLTLGLAGTMVTDGYIMNADFSAPGKTEVKRSYKHAMHSTIGNADGPPGLTPVPKEPKGEAIRQITEGLVLNLLNDMSKAGELSK